ncbi:C-type lectin 37Db-like [Drosophila takahashii]|uniref:C-type lectin 37Db-like n=1 Tax=Drosophila takahashii TaxID=29030 RepID=UPI0007E71D6E|nr:C-type lectin 37Db-like [Drosophila takahashii]
MATQPLIICVLLALALGVNAKICPSPFTQVGNKCYHVSLQKVNWHVADRSCRKLGGELMVLDNQEDKLLTTEYLKSLGLSFTKTWHDSVWAGINCLGNRRNFKLSKNGDNVTFIDWVPYQPDNSTPEEDCVAFANYNGAYGYHDIECKIEFPVVCQKDFAEEYLCLKRELFLEALL